MKKQSMAALVLAAILLILMTATAFAVANRAGLSDFIAKWQENFGFTLPESYNHPLGGEEALHAFEMDDLLITITEGLGDGWDYRFITTVALKEGVEGTLMGLDTIPFLTEDPPPESPDGSPIYYVHVEIKHEENGAMTFDVMENEDGSLSFMSDPTIISLEDVAHMVAYVRYAIGPSGKVPAKESIRQGYFPFDVPAMEAIATLKMESPGKVLKDLGITLDELFLRQTANETYYALYFQFEGGQQVDYKTPGPEGGLYLRLLAPGGQWLSQWDFTAKWLGDQYYLGICRGSDERLPTSVTLEILNGPGGAIRHREDIWLVPGTLDGERLAAYRDERERTIDLRDTLPWDEPFNDPLRRAAIHRPQGGTVPMYRNPDDPTSIIGEYYSGVALQYNATYGDFIQVSFDHYNETYTSGYIAMEHLRLGEGWRDAHPGVPTALIAPQGEEKVAVTPQAAPGGVVLWDLSAGDPVYILGRAGDYAHIAYEREGATAIGYVPANCVKEVGGVAG